MATLKLTIFKAKVLKDGRHKIRIAICHRHETCYIVTRFIIDSLSQFKNGQVVKRPDAAIINTKLRNLINKYQEKLDSISNQSQYNCRQLKELILNNVPDSTTFQDVSKEYIQHLMDEKRTGYAKLLERNNRYFTEFTRGEISLSDITPILISNYSTFLHDKKKIGNTTIGMSMSMTRTIINRGISQMLVKYDIHPFVNFSIPSSPIREVNISIESFVIFRNASPKEKKYKVAHDLFCLSFYLGGINLIDLLKIDFRHIEKIEYIRTKSKNTTQGINTTIIPIEEQAWEIIKTWMNHNTGKLDFGYKFSYSNFSRYVTRCIAALALSLGIKEKVIYYSARKTFAQLAFELGIPEGVIDYCLGHSTKSKGVIRFYTRVQEKQAEIAIKRVIDYTNNPEKYKDYIEMKADIMMMKG